MLYSAATFHCCVVWFYSTFALNIFPSFPTVRNQRILYDFSKKVVFSPTELSYMSKTVILPRDPQNQRFLLLCSNLTQVHISRAKRFFYFMQTNEKSLKPCSAGEKYFITDCKAAQLYISAADETECENNQRIYSLYRCSLNTLNAGLLSGKL